MGQRAVQLSADLRVTHRECEVDVIVSVLELFFFFVFYTLRLPVGLRAFCTTA